MKKSDTIATNARNASARGESAGGGSSFNEPRLIGEIESLIQEYLSEGTVDDKSIYFTTFARVHVIICNDRMFYKACPGECMKKVSEEGNGKYRCENCNKYFDEYRPRFTLKCMLQDTSG